MTVNTLAACAMSSVLSASSGDVWDTIRTILPWLNTSQHWIAVMLCVVSIFVAYGMAPELFPTSLVGITAFMVMSWTLIQYGFASIIRACRIAYGNSRIARDRNNLSDYSGVDRTRWSLATLRHNRVFKKCNTDVNQRFWQASLYGHYFYTDMCNEQLTLQRISRTMLTMMSRIDIEAEFFENTLISYLCQEDMVLLSQLTTSNEPVRLPSGVSLLVQRQLQMRRNSTKGNTPDAVLFTDDACIVIDAYDGNSVKHIKSKCDKYASFPHPTTLMPVSVANVYVYASHHATYQQAVVQPSTFKLHHRAGDDDMSLTSVDCINIGGMHLTITDLANYQHQMLQFRSEWMYWQRCAQSNAIIRTEETKTRRVMSMSAALVSQFLDGKSQRAMRTAGLGATPS